MMTTGERFMSGESVHCVDLTSPPKLEERTLSKTLVL